jgi:hypothetical protein
MDRVSTITDSVPVRVDVLASPPRLSAEAEKLAARGTNDKVRELRVEVVEEGIVLSGRCGTYYCKQLAQHAAMPLVQNEALINRIEVW